MNVNWPRVSTEELVLIRHRSLSVSAPIIMKEIYAIQVCFPFLGFFPERLIS